MICARTFSKPLDDDRFAFAERHLVGDLKNIAQRLGAFAVKPAHREAKLVDGLDDRIDLLGENEARQMQHRAHADAGAEIRRTRGQITEFVVEGEIQFFLQRGIQLVHRLPRLARLETGPQRLHPQMILLVDHHRESFRAVHDQPAADIFRGVFAADEMALDEQLLVQRGQIVHRLGEGIGHFRQRDHCGQNRFQHFHALRFFGPTWKRMVAQISRQPHAARHYNAVMRPVPVRGLRRRTQKLMDVFHRDFAGAALLMVLISSRTAAAVS